MTNVQFSHPYWKFPTVASFYNSPEFSLGSFNREDMWAQRRPLITYFGSSNSVYCMRVRYLLNGHDFSSATLHTVQHKGTVLGHITFSTNRGNLHIANDHEKNYKMTDLRVRFQISGNSSFLECSNVKNSLTVFHKLLTIHFSAGYAAFGKNAVTYQLTSTPDAIYFDTIFYSGEEKKLCISQLKEAIMEFSVLMSRNPQTTPSPVITEKDGEFLISEQKTDDVSLKLKTPFKPGMIEYTTLADRQYINNVRLERHVDTNKKLSGQYRFIAENHLSPTSAISTPHSAENKKYVTKIKNLSGSELENIDKAVANLLPGLDRFSLDIARRYSIHIIAELFDAAKKSDVRFKNLIETKYYQIYDEISYIAKIGKMKK